MLTLENVSFSYPRGNSIINSMSFTLSPKESLGLVGCNGAGKSTLLSLICGINLPTSGEIRINGTLIEKKSLPLIRKEIGMVFQNPDEQLFMPNILEDVAFGPKNYGCTEEEAKEKGKIALEKMGILHLADRPPYRLSGGEKRCAAIATVLAMEPSLILFDEPSAFLDPRATKNLQRIIGELPTATMIASHDLDMLSALCQRVIIMKDGNILAEGDPKELFQKEALLQEAGLELPISAVQCRKCPYLPKE